MKCFARYTWHVNGKTIYCIMSCHSACVQGASPLHPLVGGGNRRQGVQAQLQVKGAPAEVVHDAHSVAAR